ncbi:hypothetical protein AB0M02_35135 [Actinoplanes sp. NPDC051861]|uniref:hypothetical protein n=1 Tax=Actinoplanes sp. NPDC051861 TaxID=3155170 RepID=UPI003438EBDE
MVVTPRALDDPHEHSSANDHREPSTAVNAHAEDPAGTEHDRATMLLRPRWERDRRPARRRWAGLSSLTGVVGELGAGRGRALSSGTLATAVIAAVGVVLLVVSGLALGEERREAPRPAAVGVTPSPSDVASPDVVAPRGLAPFAPYEPAEADRVASSSPPPRPDQSSGVPSAVPAVTDPMVAAEPTAGATVAQPVPQRATGRPSGGTPRTEAASVRLGSPGDGETLAGTAGVSGTAVLPDGHQVWLLSRQGQSGQFRTEGACRGGRSFVCDPVRLDRGGEDLFLLDVIVVDPPTARTLQTGGSLEALPRYAARDGVTVQRKSE